VCVFVCGVGAIPPSGRHGSARNHCGRRETFVEGGGGRRVPMKRNRKVVIKWSIQRVVSVSGTRVCPRQRVEIGATATGVTHWG
jgi:hypothetical protein